MLTIERKPIVDGVWVFYHIFPDGKKTPRGISIDIKDGMPPTTVSALSTLIKRQRDNPKARITLTPKGSQEPLTFTNAELGQSSKERAERLNDIITFTMKSCKRITIADI